MKKIVLIFPLALAACVAQPEPIQDYDAPIGKYEIARPAVLSAVVYAIRGWARCPQDTPKWPHGLYRADSDPMPACDDNGSDSTFTITERPPTHQPPTHQPPTGRPPHTEPPTHQPPTGRPPHTEPPTHQPPTGRPPHTEPPRGKPPTSTPPKHERVKDDNSDANGRGGNKHNRKDKDKHSQEIAEVKKGV